MNSKNIYISILSLFLFCFPVQDLKAQTGYMGAYTASGTNVDVNTSTYLTVNALAGATTLRVNNSAMTGAGFSSSLQAGDLVLIIQMQGASISIQNNSNFGQIVSYNNAGQYELRCVSSVPNSTTINLTVPLTKTFSQIGHVQVIRVPRYSSLNVPSGSSLRPANWNGNTGGVLVMEVEGNATINGTLTATGRGFRGGSFENNSHGPTSNIDAWYSSDDDDGGNKGESIAGYETNEYQSLGVRYCRGAIANGGGGGNSHNAGGGGGANGGVVANWNGMGNPDLSGTNYSTAWNLEGGSFASSTSSGGGRGGYTYASDNRNAMSTAPGNGSWGGNNRRNYGGYGGRPLDYSSGRIFFGGGGGAGDGNNSAASGGANGGGIVILICYGNVTGSGVIEASGLHAQPTSSSHNDAPGGGGGGGTILVAASVTISNSLTLNAIGGNGGQQLISGNESEGPGGGGGGGYIAISSGSPTRNVSGGNNGITSSAGVTEFRPNGATRGGAGTGNATINMSAIVPELNPVADAGPDMDFCTSATMNANTPSTGTVGTWTVVLGTSGSFSNSSDPEAIFYGDSSQVYILEWSVINTLCLTRRDTIALNPICLPLGVELLNFSANWNEDALANIEWTAVKMENFSHFILERSKGDDVWTEVATIYPSAYNGIGEYQITDANAGFSRNFYRLKMVDVDQSIAYSKTIELDINLNTNAINMFPVPAENTLHLENNLLKGSEIKVLNSVGAIMDVTIVNNGDGTIDIDLSGLPNGYYFIQVEKNNQIIGGKSFIREIR